MCFESINLQTWLPDLIKKWGVKHFFPKTLYQSNIDTVCNKNKHPEIFLGKE